MSDVEADVNGLNAVENTIDAQNGESATSQAGTEDQAHLEPENELAADDNDLPTNGHAQETSDSSTGLAN